MIVRCSNLMKDMAVGADRGLGQALALVIGGFGKQLSAAVEPHRSSTYVLTDATMLDDFLTTLNNLIKAISTFTVGDSVENPEGVSDEQRLKSAATAVSNARHLLSRIFPKTMSDWDKARVLCRHALALLENTNGNIKSRFASADRALQAKDFGTSNAILLTIETELGGGD